MLALFASDIDVLLSAGSEKAPAHAHRYRRRHARQAALSLPRSGAEEAESRFVRSLELTYRQGAPDGDRPQGSQTPIGGPRLEAPPGSLHRLPIGLYSRGGEPV